jgi:hypothetical protein
MEKNKEKWKDQIEFFDSELRKNGFKYINALVALNDKRKTEEPKDE